MRGAKAVYWGGFSSPATCRILEKRNADTVTIVKEYVIRITARSSRSYPCGTKLTVLANCLYDSASYVARSGKWILQGKDWARFFAEG